eukprot:3577966-Rhodomonas_salina.1
MRFPGVAALFSRARLCLQIASLACMVARLDHLCRLIVSSVSMSYILNGYVGRSYWMSSEWHPLSAAWSALSFPMSQTCALTQTMTSQSAPNLLGAVEATHRGR